MAKVTFDVSGQDPDKSLAGSSEPPKPGVYAAKILEINPGFSKDTTGKPDKTRPRLEVIYQITDNRYPGSRVWCYLTFDEASQWKLDQFLLTFGLATRTKRKGTFDTDKLIGQPCRVRVKAGSNQSGEYRADFGAVLPVAGEEDAEAEADAPVVEEDAEAVESEAEAEEEIFEAEEEEASEEAEFVPYEEADLKAMSAAELKEICESWELDYKGKKKSEVVALILEAQTSEEETEEETPAEEDDDLPF